MSLKSAFSISQPLALRPRRAVLPVMLCALLALQGCRLLSGEDSLESALLPNEGGARIEGDVGNEAVTIDSVQARDPQAKLGAKHHKRIVTQNGGAYSDRQLEELIALEPLSPQITAKAITRLEA